MAGSKTAALLAIRLAWKEYQATEKYGLAFGKALFEWRKNFGGHRTRGREGEGLAPMLEQVGIPESIAYWWIDRYEIAANLKQPKTVNPNFNRAGTRGIKDKPRLTSFIRKLDAIGATGITSPFPSAADYAIKECSSKEAKAVLYCLDLAIERLKEYRKKFEGIR